jgi:hypothetical protein
VYERSERFENKLDGGNLMRELGPLLAGIAGTQFEKGLDGESKDVGGDG